MSEAIATVSERTKLDIVVIDDNTPLTQDNFYQYLNSIEVPGKRVDYNEALKGYLASLGFDKTQHIIEGRVLKICRYCYEIYSRNWMPDRTPMAMVELFEPDPEGKSCYLDIERRRYAISLLSFTISRRPGTFHIKAKLLELLQNRGLVYPLNSFNFYFEVNHNQLHIRYQFIIGSRLVCNLKE